MDYGKIRREYIHEPLLIESVDTNPFTQFQKWFDEAFPIFEQDTNAMAIATSGADGRPSVRMVLLKGLTEDGFRFFTDYESHKGRDLLENPQAALLFFWPGMDRQIRIEGEVRKVPSEVSDQYFLSRPLESRVSAVISPQSHTITRKEMEERRNRVMEAGEIERPERWGGFELVPDYFEFWQGRKSRFHDRIVYDRRGLESFEISCIAP